MVTAERVPARCRAAKCPRFAADSASLAALAVFLYMNRRELLRGGDLITTPCSAL